MYKLYARKNAGSAAVEALLEVLGVEYQCVDVVKTAEAKAPKWYFDINPRGEVPTLELPDGTIMTESAAIMIYLADIHADRGFAPAFNAVARAHYLRWMIYLAATPYGSDLRMYYPERYSTNSAHTDGIKAKAEIDLACDLAVFANGIGEGPFILGAHMSAADIYAAMLVSWSNDVEGEFSKHPKLANLYANVVANPDVRKVWERNGMLTAV